MATDDFDAALAEAEAEAEELGLVDPAEEDDLFDDGVEVEEHLKDAVEGSLRLKRLLSRDEEDSTGKKRKTEIDPATEKKIVALMTKWMQPNDRMIRHVLEQCSGTELDELAGSKYVPERSNVWKSAGELLSTHLAQLRQTKSTTGYGTDHVAAAKFRWKLTPAQEQQLRKLSHKDLRYVLDNFTGTESLDDVISQAAAEPADDAMITQNALPEDEGVATMGRFSRLELIDPIADAAVFGDANLTFALRLAKHRKALGHCGRVIATTFEELGTLRERYKEIDDNIQVLEEHCAEVYHGVDCTRIALDEKFKGMEGTLGAVYYNFPHSGAIQGFFDGHPIVNWRHENLMRLFFRALRTFVKEDGIVKVASNAGAVGVRYYYIINSAVENEFEHVETVPFLQWNLHRYGRSYGDKRDVYKRPDAKKNESYNAQAAERDMVYCFRYKPSGETLGKQMVRLPPTLKTIMACTDGPFKNLTGPGRQTLAENLHKRFVTEISGTHVG
eukprot:TRINITY_DN5707_c0_g1_i1.p1 TRINITY_DN5707_c0_g1~~TRINITY_DN5707_c0_g1_i1.p1  ORF type:complete len:501 (-),score=116.53 TRINITY_DN5707_c0_g1_i1:194-1696(-)